MALKRNPHGGRHIMFIIERKRSIERGQTTAALAIATLLRDAELSGDEPSLAREYRAAAESLAREYGVDAQAAYDAAYGEDDE